jgi:hypothetical protein
MCPSGATGLLADYKAPTQRVGLAQSEPHHHLIENEGFGYRNQNYSETYSIWI